MKKMMMFLWMSTSLFAMDANFPMTREESAKAQNFHSAGQKRLTLVYKSSKSFLEPGGNLLGKDVDYKRTDRTPHSLKVCTADNLGTIAKVEVYTCCGHLLKNTELKLAPNGHCAVVNNMVIANAKYKVRVYLEHNDIAVFP